MNRKEFCKGFAAKYGVSQKAATAMADAFFEYLGEKIVEEPYLCIYGFGAFKHKELAARVITLPLNGEKMDVPARKSVMFEPSIKCKALINGETPPEEVEPVESE